MTRPFESRRAERKLIVLGGTVRQGETRHPCLIRDVSETGLFLYSNFAPPIGETIQISFGGAVFQGCVVRVETKDSGAAIGVGITFTKPRTAGTLDVLTQASNPSQP